MKKTIFTLGLALLSIGSAFAQTRFPSGTFVLTRNQPEVCDSEVRVGNYGEDFGFQFYDKSGEATYYHGFNFEYLYGSEITSNSLGYRAVCPGSLGQEDCWDITFTFTGKNKLTVSTEVLQGIPGESSVCVYERVKAAH